MSRVDAAASMDRLPWLSDEPRAPPVKRGKGLLGWAAAAIVAVAGAGFWIGVRSIDQPMPVPPHQAASTTVQLPAARPAQPQVNITPQPAINPAPQPQVRPAPVHEINVSAPLDRPAIRQTVSPSSQAKGAEATAKQSEQAAAAIPPLEQPFVMPKPWNPREFAGAAGRIVQIGAFGSTPQAKEGWWFMVRAYPAMARLPAVVRISRNSKGREFYRFQVGTTSEAHSEVLCQRMLKIGLSCAIIGLPWKAKVER